MPSIEKEAVRENPKNKYVDITITLKFTDEVSKFFVQKSCNDPCCGDQYHSCYCDTVPAKSAKEIIDDLKENNTYGGPDGPLSELSEAYDIWDFSSMDWKITIVDHKEK